MAKRLTYDQRQDEIEQFKATVDFVAMVERLTHQSVVKHKICCPFHEEQTPSCHIYEDGYKCFGCHKAGDVADFVTELVFAGDFKQFVDWVVGEARGLDLTPRPYDKQRQEKPSRAQLPSDLADKFRAGLTDQHYNIWRAQHISPSTLRRFKIGWTGKRYSFPWFYRGKLTAIKNRRCEVLSPNLDIKYLSVKGSRFSVAPFNVDMLFQPAADKGVLIVEDEKSAMAAYEYGYIAVSAPANAFKEEWAEFFMHLPNVTIVADNDAAGLSNAKRVKGILKRVKVVQPPNLFGVDGSHCKDLFDFRQMELGGKLPKPLSLTDWLTV